MGTVPVPGGSFPYTPLGYQRLLSYAANVLTGASWASTSGGQVTFTTTTAHGVTVGATFVISGMTPAGYNGTYAAISGTTGSTLVAALTVNPGTETVLGTLVGSLAVASNLPVPVGATIAFVAVSGAPVNYRDDEVAPTATIGFPVNVGGYLTYSGALAKIQFIQQSATAVLDVMYYM